MGCFADKRSNYLAGSPMVDFGDVKARYVRLTTTGTQRNGFAGALWNIKVFGEFEMASPQLWMGLSGLDWNGTEWRNDGGMLGGVFQLKSGQVSRKRIDGQEAIVLAPGICLEFMSPVINPKRSIQLQSGCMKITAGFPNRQTSMYNGER